MSDIKNIKIEPSVDFLLTIAFAAGCFGFGWTPFGVLFILLIMKSLGEE
jgi:hypothetical protein